MPVSLRTDGRVAVFRLVRGASRRHDGERQNSEIQRGLMEGSRPRPFEGSERGKKNRE